MSLVFSALVPHPPILIPAIGKENSARLEKTRLAYQELEHDLYAAQAETIIVISPHGPIQGDVFTINLSPEFKIDFEEFGDFSTRMELKGDVGLAYKIREALETKAPLQLISQLKLDHGSAIPLYMLAQNLKNIRVIPLYYSGLNLEAHFEFGRLLKQELMVNKNRIALIASGDLSHRLTKDAPAGYSPQGAKFDKKIAEYLQNKKAREVLRLNEKLISAAGECALRSIVLLLGILEGIEYEAEILAYEAPFGVGYLTMNFKL